MEIGVDKSLRIRSSVRRVIAINVVASERWNFLPLVYLCWTRPRFRKLSGQSRYAQDRFVGAPDEYQAHLQEQLDFRLNGGLLAVVE